MRGRGYRSATFTRIGLVDVDGHNFPNLALMKISAWHKAQGHHVDWLNGFEHYDLAYMSRVFTDEYTADYTTAIQADAVIHGGTGYDLRNTLPDEIEHIYPDYSLYPNHTKDTAFGFLTRGCPRACPFCIVSEKEGGSSRQVADLPEFWQGQRNIKLLDPNLLAAKEHPTLLESLAVSGALVDFTQGLDIRLVTSENIPLLRAVKVKMLHFAWDNPNEDLEPHFARFAQAAPKLLAAHRCGVYVLTNFGSTLEQDLYRIHTLRDMGYSPYVMIYDKPSAPQTTRYLQRWVNNPRVFKTQPDFFKFDPSQG